MAGAEPVGGYDGDLVRLGYGACGRGVARMIRRLTGFQVAVLTSLALGDKLRPKDRTGTRSPTDFVFCKTGFIAPLRSLRIMADMGLVKQHRRTMSVLITKTGQTALKAYDNGLLYAHERPVSYQEKKLEALL